jgi:protease IV
MAIVHMKTCTALTLPGVRHAMLAVVVFACLCAAGCTVEVPGLRYPRELAEQTVQESTRRLELNKIAMIEIEGFIGEDGALLSGGGTTPADIRQKLEMAAKDRYVKGVLLRIDSPGGEVTASDLIYSEIRAFCAKTKKPVVAYTMSVAASGAYYIAIASDDIVAHPTGITGSVGVIMLTVNVERLLGYIGVQTLPVKSGEKKDMGSPFRSMSADEKSLFQELNQTMFDRFLGLVKARRHLSEEASRTISDGRVVSAPEALKLGLVDKMGDIEAALDEVRKKAGIPAAKVVAYYPYTRHNTNIYTPANADESATQQINVLAATLGSLRSSARPRFLYLWAPGL